jgi:alkylhydroperoxidase family enzyme
MHKNILLLALTVGLLLPIPTQAQDLQDYGQVSRLPAVKDPMSDPILKEMFEDIRAHGGQILNLHLTYAHAPKIGRANRAMAYALRFEAEVPRQFREIAMIRTGQILDAQYELNQHIPLGLACGLTRAQLDAMPSWKTSDLFDGKQRALLAYADAMVMNRGEVDDATFDSFAKFFTPREIVELTVSISAYTSTALFTKALRIKPETDGRAAAPGKC